MLTNSLHFKWLVMQSLLWSFRLGRLMLVRTMQAWTARLHSCSLISMQFNFRHFTSMGVMLLFNNVCVPGLQLFLHCQVHYSINLTWHTLVMMSPLCFLVIFCSQVQPWAQLLNLVNLLPDFTNYLVRVVYLSPHLVFFIKSPRIVMLLQSLFLNEIRALKHLIVVHARIGIGVRSHNLWIFQP